MLLGRGCLLCSHLFLPVMPVTRDDARLICSKGNNTSSPGHAINTKPVLSNRLMTIACNRDPMQFQPSQLLIIGPPNTDFVSGWNSSPQSHA
ncbi:hypothetical protein F4775DRAFT_561149 [Biscogniauxia sp. FL1348]|nr:hypothetical protein F4775DRAFT_561149 [Biscogniauxia sp. FL1348]